MLLPLAIMLTFWNGQGDDTFTFILLYLRDDQYSCMKSLCAVVIVPVCRHEGCRIKWEGYRCSFARTRGMTQQTLSWLHEQAGH